MKDKILCSEINLVSLIIAKKRFDGMGNCFLHDVCPMEADGPLGKWELQIFFLMSLLMLMFWLGILHHSPQWTFLNLLKFTVSYNGCLVCF